MDTIAEIVKRSMNAHMNYQHPRYGRISVVGGVGGYSTPKDNEGPYTHVELGMWTRGPEYLDGYAEILDEKEGELRVYGYVPVALLGRLLSEV